LFPSPPTLIDASEPTHRFFEVALKAFYGHRTQQIILQNETKKTKTNKEKTKQITTTTTKDKTGASHKCELLNFSIQY